MARYTGRRTRTSPGKLGFDALPWSELRTLRPQQYGDRVRNRVGDCPAFLRFDVDFVDPAFAPGTGTPEVGGPTSHDALAYLGALTQIYFRLRLCGGFPSLRPKRHNRLASRKRDPRDVGRQGLAEQVRLMRQSTLALIDIVADLIGTSVFLFLPRAPDKESYWPLCQSLT